MLAGEAVRVEAAPHDRRACVEAMLEGEVQVGQSSAHPIGNGTADQTHAVAAVASHFLKTAHSLDQSSDGRATPLGRLNSVCFLIRLELPPGFRRERSMKLERHFCG